MKILLIEREPFLSGMYQAKLQIDGYLVTVAPDPKTAQKMLAEDKFDMLLMDVNSGAPNSLDLLKSIRNSADKVLAKIQIIILTNIGKKADIEQALRLGADDYIVKSNFTPAEVVEKIKKHLKK